MSKQVSIDKMIRNNNIVESMSNTRANLLKIVMNNREINEQKQAKILVIGLSGAGKSTLMKFLSKGAKIEESRRTTLAFTRYNIDFGKLKMLFIDAPGQKTYWSKWAEYADAADGILFLLDSANFKNVALVNNLIYNTLKLQKKSIPTLFLANKQDLSNAISAESINTLLQIDRNMPDSAIYAISAINGSGVVDAFKWLLENIIERI